MSTTEAADLARIILDDSEGDLPNDLYPLNVREARTLAHAVIDQADALDRVREALHRLEGGHHIHGGTCTCGVRSDRARDLTEHLTGIVRAALNGENR